MKNIYSVILTVCFSVSLAFPVANQGQNPQWKGKIEYENGIKIVHNFRNEVFKSIQFVEDLSIGTEEGEETYMFLAPRDIDADSEGNIYVLDFMDKTVKSFSPGGQFRGNISRKGQGPGEIVNPIVFCVDNQDNVNILDSWKIEILDNKGIYIRTIRLEDFAEQISENKIGQLVLGFMARVRTISKKGEMFYKVATLDSKDDKICDIYLKKQPYGLNIQSQDIFLRYPYFVRWANNSKGNIYIGTADRYEIVVFSPEGQKLFKFTKEYEPVPIEPEIRRKAINLMKRVKSTNLEERKKYLKYYPVFMSISTDEQDRVWVMHYQPYNKGKLSKDRTFDVFSSEGRYLFTTKLDKFIFPHKLVFKNGYLYALVVDESYYSRAVRFRVVEN